MLDLIKYYFKFISIVLIGLSAHLNAFTEWQLLEKSSHCLFNNLLTLTEEQIKNSVEETRYLAEKHKINEKNILEKLKEEAELGIAYHQPRVGNKRDIKALKKSLMVFLAVGIGYGLLYAGYRKWHKPYRDEINKIYRENSITERVVNWGQTTEYILSGSNSDRLACLLNKTKNYGPIELALGTLGAIVCYQFGGARLKEWLHPHHQEKYEKLCLIKSYLDQALKTKRKNIIFI